MYHTHSGVGLVGASIWDLHDIMRDLDPQAGRHQLRRGARHRRRGAGRLDRQLPNPAATFRGIAVKDFAWAKDDKGGWYEKWCPMGDGMVRLDQFMGYGAGHRL